MTDEMDANSCWFCSNLQLCGSQVQSKTTYQSSACNDFVYDPVTAHPIMTTHGQTNWDIVILTLTLSFSLSFEGVFSLFIVIYPQKYKKYCCFFEKILAIQKA